MIQRSTPGVPLGRFGCQKSFDMGTRSPFVNLKASDANVSVASTFDPSIQYLVALYPENKYNSLSFRTYKCAHHKLLLYRELLDEVHVLTRN